MGANIMHDRLSPIRSKEVMNTEYSDIINQKTNNTLLKKQKKPKLEKDPITKKDARGSRNSQSIQMKTGQDKSEDDLDTNQVLDLESIRKMSKNTGKKEINLSNVKGKQSG